MNSDRSGTVFGRMFSSFAAPVVTGLELPYSIGTLGPRKPAIGRNYRALILALLPLFTACGADHYSGPLLSSREEQQQEIRRNWDSTEERNSLDQQRRILARHSRLDAEYAPDSQTIRTWEREIRALDNRIAEIDRALRHRTTFADAARLGAVTGLLIGGFTLGAVMGSSQRLIIPTFPWPPPEPSARAILPDRLQPTRTSPPLNLLMVADRLEHALQEAGYGERGFYSAPGGFALVTRLERIQEDGRPASQRFLPPGEREPFTLANSFERLFGAAPAGRYRLITLVVTDQPIPGVGPQLDIASAGMLVARSSVELMGDLRSGAFGPNHRIAVFIYEYRRDRREEEARAQTPGRWEIDEHLRLTGLARSLRVVP